MRFWQAVQQQQQQQQQQQEQEQEEHEQEEEEGLQSTPANYRGARSYKLIRAAGAVVCSNTSNSTCSM
jgi:hypothetical protein